MDSLQNLQTLVLQSCSFLITLPKGIRQATSLINLDLGITVYSLHSMPPWGGGINLPPHIVKLHCWPGGRMPDARFKN